MWGPPVLSLGVQRYILDSCLPQWVFQSPILSPPLRATAKGGSGGETAAQLLGDARDLRDGR